MAESTGAGLGNSNSEFVLKTREEEHLLNGTERKKDRKKRKDKDIEEKKSKSNATRLLYNETPEKSESVLPSPKKVKTLPFSKVWGDEDEISILRGMIEFKNHTGRDAGHNMVEFRAFILESLILQATLIQLREKVRNLKDKYEKSLEKGNGGRTQHEVELFQLCQKIWHNSSGTGQPEQQNIIGHQNILVKEKHNIPEKGLPVKEKQNIPESGRPKIPEIGRARQLIIEQHKIIPVTGLDRQTLDALWKRVSNDIELVVNSKPCLRGNQKEVDLRVLDLCSQSTELRIKLGKLVLEKAISPELRDFPEVLEQEVLRAYLEAKIEHAQLLLNAYNGFIKDHTGEAQSSASAINK